MTIRRLVANYFSVIIHKGERLMLKFLGYLVRLHCCYLESRINKCWHGFNLLKIKFEDKPWLEVV
jgi:hypothetical protein